MAGRRVGWRAGPDPAVAGLAVARGWVLAQWAAGRLPGSIAIGLHVLFLAAAALGLWVLANLS